MQPQNYSSSSVITNGGQNIVSGGTKNNNFPVSGSFIAGVGNGQEQREITATMEDMKNTE